MLAQRWPSERVDEITEKMVRDYLADLRETGSSPSTRTLRLTVLRHAMRDVADTLRPVNGVALASVITSGVLGIATSSIAIWSARQNAKLARETRTQQRLADSYLEVLRIVEREGLWIEASVANWKIAAEEAEVEPIPEARNWLPGFKRVKVPEPAVTDRATTAAHLAAFGSDNVRRLYQAWRSTVTAIDTEEDALHWDADQNYPYPPSLDNLKRLLNALQPNERGARQALAGAIAKELGHRSGVTQRYHSTHHP
ncbi:MAG: hypothetical protein ACRDS1_15990 [Pseudonocardiaceae bacterium]